MRPVSTQQDPLRHPLNELLGTRANVRLLRVMASEVEGPLTAPDVAKRSGLTVPGAQKALKALYESGFIKRVGGGRKHQYEIQRSDRIMQIIMELFKAEKDRYVQLIESIKRKIKDVVPPPHALWITAIPQKTSDSLTLCMLHESRQLTSCIRQLRAGLNQVEKAFDITLELNGYTKADLPKMDSDGITVLYGVLPSEESISLSSAMKPMTHQEKDRWQKNLLIILSKAIESDSSLIRRAKEHLDRSLSADQGMATKDLSEWRDILNEYSIQRLTQFLTSSSERANRLRQSNPFLAVLTPEERAQLTADLKDQK